MLLTFWLINVLPCLFDKFSLLCEYAGTCSFVCTHAHWANFYDIYVHTHIYTIYK